MDKIDYLITAHGVINLIYFISGTHFYHSNIIKLYKNENGMVMLMKHNTH